MNQQIETNEDQQETPKWRPIMTVEDGGLIPPFHGAIRFNMDEESMLTAVIPLNLILRALWKVWVAIKVGSLGVPMDPRAAYYQGRIDSRDEIIAQIPGGNLLSAHEEALAKLRELTVLLEGRERQLEMVTKSYAKIRSLEQTNLKLQQHNDFLTGMLSHAEGIVPEGADRKWVFPIGDARAMENMVKESKEAQIARESVAKEGGEAFDESKVDEIPPPSRARRGDAT